MATSALALVTSALKAGSPSSALRVSYSLRPATGELPALVFTIVSHQDDPHLRGDGGLRNARVQVDAWADSAQVAEVLADQAKGLMLAAPFGVYAEGGFYEQEDVTRLHRVSRDFSIWFEE